MYHARVNLTDYAVRKLGVVSTSGSSVHAAVQPAERPGLLLVLCVSLVDTQSLLCDRSRGVACAPQVKSLGPDSAREDELYFCLGANTTVTLDSAAAAAFQLCWAAVPSRCLSSVH